MSVPKGTLPALFPHQSVLLKAEFILLLHIYSQVNYVELIFVPKGTFSKTWSWFSGFFLSLILIPGRSWLPGIFTSWNLANSCFCQDSANSGIINPEAFVIFQFSSIYTPSDPSWTPTSKSGPESLLILELDAIGKGLPLTCHSHVQLPCCRILIVSWGFAKSNPPTCPLDLVHSVLWPSEPHTKMYLFDTNLSFHLDCGLPLVISPTPGIHLESTSYWPLSFPPSCFTHSPPLTH